MMLFRIAFLLILTSAFPLLAQTVYGDLLPDAPELATRGSYAVGVRTMQLTNSNQLNIAEIEKAIAPIYDRDLTIEIWYPTAGGSGEGSIEYKEVLGVHLKEKAYGKYLLLPEDANSNTWTGFKPRTAVGLQLVYKNKE